MSILKNALQAIECGVEDYQQGSDARLKSSIRNMHAGLLLLLKEKLSRLSDKDSNDALIKRNVSPSIVKGKIVWKGDGKKTVDISEIRERFKSLQIQFDWKKFEQITSIRNEVEHYFTNANKQVITESLSKSFVLMRNFMIRELKIDPQKRISSNSWDILIKVDDVYQAEKNVCDKSQKFFRSYSEDLNAQISQITCIDCESDLVKFKKDGSMECRACKKKLASEEAIEHLADIVFGVDDYIAAKEGGDSIIITCWSCDKESFNSRELVCACCGETTSGDCSYCSNPIPSSELGSGVCSYCEYKMSKDD